MSFWNEQLAATALRDAPVIVVALDVEGRILEINAFFEQLSGWSADEVRGRDWVDTFVPERERQRIRNRLRAASSGARIDADNVNAIVTKNGDERDIAWTDHPLTDARDGVVGLLAFGRDVTESARAERSRADEALRLRQILDSQFGYVALLDRQGVIVEVNALPLERLGVPRAAVVGQNYRAFQGFVWQAAKGLDGAFARAVDGAPFRGDITLRFPHGGGRVVDLSLSPLRDAAGAITNVVVVGVDVTERREVEHRLRQTQALARVGGWGYDIASRRAWWSEEAARLLAVAADDAVESGPRAFLRAVHPEDVALVEVALLGAEAGRASNVDHRLLAQDDRVAHVRSQVRPVYDGRGAVTAVEATLQDVTDRTQSAVRLRETQELARLGAWELDRTRDRLVWSDEVYAIFELDPATGASYAAFLERVHPDDRATVDEAYERSVHDRTAYSIVHRLLLPDGRVKWLHERGRTEYDRQGAPVRSLGTVQDVTELKVAEIALRASLAEKEILLREIHHRVKNNLQIVSSLLHFQAKKVSAPEQARAFAELRHRLYAMSLVHERLYQSPDVAHVDLGEYLRGIVAELVRGVDLQRRVGVSLEATGAIRLPMERALPCGMIAAELVLNVLKYAYPGDLPGRATVAVHRDGPRVVLAVDDEGVGFPAGFDPRQPASFGWELVRMLGQQLDGELVAWTDRGAHVRLTFATDGALDA